MYFLASKGALNIVMGRSKMHQFGGQLKIIKKEYVYTYFFPIEMSI